MWFASKYRQRIFYLAMSRLGILDVYISRYFQPSGGLRKYCHPVLVCTESRDQCQEGIYILQGDSESKRFL